MQVGAASFVDEGVDSVLDTLEERAGVNALMLASLTFTKGTGGRQIPGQPLPDHGIREYSEFQGGNFAASDPRYYRGTILGEGVRAPEHGAWDLFGEVLPKARARGMRSFAFIQESPYDPVARYVPNYGKVLEQDVYGRKAPTACFNNPDFRNWHLSIIEDYLKSYPLDGIMWCSERWGPLDELIHHPVAAKEIKITCFCPYCRAEARDRGIDVQRAQQGFRELHDWNQRTANGDIPVDGAFVSFWRLLIKFPEIMAWEKLWSDSQHQLFREIYGLVKAIDDSKLVGWHIWHYTSFSPFYRAEQDFAEISRYADFIKPVLYNNCAGPRFHTRLARMHRTIFADAGPQETYRLFYRMLGYDERDFDELPTAGFTAEYVRSETARTLASVAPEVEVWPGIDIDVPTPEGTKRTQPEDVRQAVLAALEAGASGVVLSRKYSEMRLDNLGGCGQALRELEAREAAAGDGA